MYEYHKYEGKTKMNKKRRNSVTIRQYKEKTFNT